MTTFNGAGGQNRDAIRPGLQGSGQLTRGIVADILTNSQFHPHGIKVRLESGEVGRVQNIIGS